MEEEKKKLKLRLEEIELYEFLTLFEVFYNFKKMVDPNIKIVKIDTVEMNKYFKLSFEQFKKIIERSGSIYMVCLSSPPKSEYDGSGYMYHQDGFINVEKIRI